MPTYQYACTACGHQLEAVQSFSDAALTECPNCQGQLRKVFSAVGIVFKGSGFYRTDSRSGASASASASESGGSAAASSKTESKDAGSSTPAKSDSGTSATPSTSSSTTSSTSRSSSTTSTAAAKAGASS